MALVGQCLPGMRKALGLTLLARDGVESGTVGLLPRGSWLFALLIPRGSMCNNGIMWLCNATVSEMLAVSKRGTKKRNYHPARAVCAHSFQPGVWRKHELEGTYACICSGLV